MPYLSVKPQPSFQLRPRFNLTIPRVFSFFLISSNATESRSGANCSLGEYRPVPTNNQQFYLCTSDGPAVHDCPVGTTFNPDISLCTANGSDGVHSDLRARQDEIELEETYTLMERDGGEYKDSSEEVDEAQMFDQIENESHRLLKREDGSLTGDEASSSFANLPQERDLYPQEDAQSEDSHAEAAMSSLEQRDFSEIGPDAWATVNLGEPVAEVGTRSLLYGREEGISDHKDLHDDGEDLDQDGDFLAKRKITAKIGIPATPQRPGPIRNE